MATIFPLSASVGQQFDGYAFDGESWNIIGENWKPFIYSATEPDFHEAGFIWVDSNEVVDEIYVLPSQAGNAGKFLTTSGSVSSWGTVDLTPYLTQSSASSTYLTQVSASSTYLTQSNASTVYQQKVENVESTEIGYLDGVTSGIQSQLNSKLNLSTASTTYLTISNPVITGVTSINAIEESITLAAISAGGTVTYDVLSNNAITYYTSNASANWTLNIRGNSGNTLNSMLSTGQSLTIAFAVTNGTTAYRQTALQIDGSSVTPKWQGGSAPSTGNASSIDIYSITIIKTGDAAFTVWESQTRFA